MFIYVFFIDYFFYYNLKIREINYDNYISDSMDSLTGLNSALRFRTSALAVCSGFTGSDHTTLVASAL